MLRMNFIGALSPCIFQNDNIVIDSQSYFIESIREIDNAGKRLAITRRVPIIGIPLFIVLIFILSQDLFNDHPDMVKKLFEIMMIPFFSYIVFFLINIRKLSKVNIRSYWIVNDRPIYIEQKDDLNIERELRDLKQRISDNPHIEVASSNSTKPDIYYRIQRWLIVIILYTLSALAFCFSIWGTYKHYPSISELTHITGRVYEYSIVDGHNNHEITIKLEGVSPRFYFQKVDFFPPMKQVLHNGVTIDLWVDKDRFDKGKSPEIWQLAISGVIIMSRDAIVDLLQERAKDAETDSFWLFCAGSLMALALIIYSKYRTKKTLRK